MLSPTTDNQPKPLFRKGPKFLLGATLSLSLIGVIACTQNKASAKPNFVFKDAPPKAGVVAKINGEEITEERLIGDDKMDFIDLKKREYELRMDRLNKLLVDLLVGAEAKKAGIPLEEFIEKKVVGGKIKISDADYKKFVADKKIPESQITPQIKERINSYLEGEKKQELIQSYVAKLTKSSPVEVYFTKPKFQVEVEPGTGPANGPADAPVTIVEFSDFQCPFCSKGAERMDEIKKKYGKKVRVVFRHFPLPMHPEAKPASEAAMCVNEQSPDKFWKFHDTLFKNQDKFDKVNLEKFAEGLKVDMTKFKECFDSGKYREAVAKDLEYGEKLGVRSTPTFFINGQLLSGALPMESFSEIIDEELELAKK
jgi:protein-disulfide isomerase